MTKQLRNAWGSIKDPSPVTMRVEKEHRDKFAAIAKRADMSRAVLFGLLVDAIELDEHGIARCIPAEMRPDLVGEELPTTG